MGHSNECLILCPIETRERNTMYKYNLGGKDNPIKRYTKRNNTDNDKGIKVMLTRYCHETSWRKAKGPRGGKAIREFARYVWYADGVFYQMRRVCNKNEDGTATFTNILEPVTGVITDIHGNQSRDTGIPVVSINCKNGVPIEVEFDGEWMEIGEGWAYLEDVLYLDGKRIPRWTKEAEYAA